MFVILANCNFVPGRYDDWQSAYDKLNDYVWEHEPTTLTYYFGIPVHQWVNQSATTHMLAFEIYTDREALYTTHLNSAVMSGFLSALPETMITGLDLSNYEDVGGFLDRFNDKRECEVMVDVRISCKPEARQALLSRLSTLASIISESDYKGVLTFFVLKSLDSEQGVRIFQRFQSWKAQTNHVSDQPVLNFWRSSKEDILSMESQAYVPNGKGWLHRGSSQPTARL